MLESFIILVLSSRLYFVYATRVGLARKISGIRYLHSPFANRITVALDYYLNVCFARLKTIKCYVICCRYRCRNARSLWCCLRRIYYPPCRRRLASSPPRHRPLDDRNHYWLEETSVCVCVCVCVCACACACARARVRNTFSWTIAGLGTLLAGHFPVFAKIDSSS